MLNDHGLLGERRFYKNIDIDKKMPESKLRSALLGSAVLFNDEEVYITNVFNRLDYVNFYSFELSNGVCVNQSCVKFFISDENDDTESSNKRIESIKYDYKRYNYFNTRFNYSEELKAMNDLKKETDLVNKMFHDGQEKFLSIINSLKQVIVKVHSGDNNEATIITTIQDFQYHSRVPKLDDKLTIKFNYDDILIKINGTFIPVTSKNLKFIYDYKHLTFKELLEKHNNNEIKSNMGALPK